MKNKVKESTLLRKSLIGIRVTPFDSPPLFQIGSWKVFDAGRVDTLPPDDRRRNLNYQIERGFDEKVLIRVFLDKQEKLIQKVKFYYLQSKTDDELAYLVMMELITRLTGSHCLSLDVEIIRYAF